jgi:hypothetical protein
MMDWIDLLKQPSPSDHIVQVYQDEDFLVEAVVEYVATGLRAGEGAIIIATPDHRHRFVERMWSDGLKVDELVEQGALRLLDAESTLASFMAAGLPQWNHYHKLVGGLIAEMRLDYPAVRAYGEMVDVLWRRQERAAAIRLEEFWNDLAKLQSFSLFCAYYMDPLDAGTYGGPLECVCKVHTHLIPARNYESFNKAVYRASETVLGKPLAGLLMSVSDQHPPETLMPAGQAALLWLKKHMPRTTDRVLREVQDQLS